MRLSLPATASRLMSAIRVSLAAGFPHASLSLHAFRRMKSCVAPIGFFCGPVRRHPRCPAQLPEAAETDRFNSPRRDRQFGIPIELVSIVKKQEIRKRLAQVA